MSTVTYKWHTVVTLLKDTLSREDTPEERTQIPGNKSMNACNAPSHQRTPSLIRTKLFGRRGVSSREGPLYTAFPVIDTHHISILALFASQNLQAPSKQEALSLQVRAWRTRRVHTCNSCQNYN